MNDQDLARCGVAARRQLHYVWDQPPSPVARFAIDAVVATAATDPNATADLLSRALLPERLVTHGANDLHSLCDSTPKLVGLLPRFVEDLYSSVMAYEEVSTDPTSLLGSAILPMSSTRRQDVDHAKWTLVQHYPSFMAASLPNALAALSRLVATGDVGTAATLNGRTFVPVADDSGVWDRGRSHSESDLLGLLDAFEAFVAAMTPREAITLFDVLAAAPHPAAIWRRVLSAATRNEHIAVHLMPLDIVVESWANADLFERVAELVQACFAERSGDERERVERIILARHPGPDNGSYEWHSASYAYLRLLHALDPEAAGVDASTAQELSSPPEPRRSFGMASAVPLAEGPERYGLRLNGDLDARLWPLVESVQQFVDDHLNDAPDDQAVADSLATVQQVLGDPDLAGASAQLRQFADCAIAGAAERWTRRRVDVDPKALTTAKDQLLRLRSHGLPAPRDSERDGGLTVIPQGPRTDAARGLVQLARLRDYVDDDLLDAINDLANDGVPWVRYEVVRNLFLLRGSAPEAMWELLGDRADRETHDGVLRGIANAAWALRVDTDAAVDLLSRVTARIVPAERRESGFEACTEVAGLLWVLQGNAAARDVLARLTAMPSPGEAVTALLHELRSAGTMTSDDDEVRARVLELLWDLAIEANATLGDASETGEPDEARAQEIKRAVTILDGVASQIFFASGASEARKTGDDPAMASVRLADESYELVLLLGQVPVARLTHHLVKFLAHVLAARPARTLLAIRQVVVTGGVTAGYQLDGMAVDLVVGIIERLLADHRGTLQNPECLSALREILDVFVDAGWPRAHRLAYGLEEIFR